METLLRITREAVVRVREKVSSDEDTIEYQLYPTRVTLLGRINPKEDTTSGGTMFHKFGNNLYNPYRINEEYDPNYTPCCAWGLKVNDGNNDWYNQYAMGDVLLFA